LSRQKAGCETDQRPADESRDEEGGTIGRVREEPEDEIILTAPGEKRERGSSGRGDETADSCGRGRLLDETDRGEHGCKPDRYAKREDQRIRTQCEQNHERQARENGFQDPSPSPHRGPDDFLGALAFRWINPRPARRAAERGAEDLRSARLGGLL